MAVKTSKRNQIFIVQKRVGRNWHMITDAIFRKRANARECSRELNNVAGITGRGPNRRYRVATMRVVESATTPTP